MDKCQPRASFYHHHGDTIEFTVNPPEDVAYHPEEGDLLWFALKSTEAKENAEPIVSMTQKDTHFEIIDTSFIPTGNYIFEVGIIYSNNKHFTGFSADLTIDRRAFRE